MPPGNPMIETEKTIVLEEGSIEGEYEISVMNEIKERQLEGPLLVAFLMKELEEVHDG